MNTKLKKAIITAVIPAIGLPGVTHQAITESSDYGIQEYASICPVTIELSELGIDEGISSISFTSDAKTEHLEGEYFVQGILYYSCDEYFTYRIFRDEITEDSDEYLTVAGKESSKSVFYIGEETPLNIDANSRIILELTWVSPEEITLSDLELTGESGRTYSVAAGEFYTARTEMHEVVESDDDLAKKCLGFNRYFEVGPNGPANTINPDDYGALSIGLIQMRGINAQALLQGIRSVNPERFDTIARKWDSGILDLLNVTDFTWEEITAPEGSALHAFIQELLNEDWAIEAQIKYLIKHEKNVIEDARANGIIDHRSILLYARAVNYGPYTGSSEHLRELGNNGSCTFENASAAIEYNRCDEAIELAESEEFSIVTLNNAKER